MSTTNQLQETQFQSAKADSSPIVVHGSQGQPILNAYEGDKGNGNLLVKDSEGETKARIAAGTFTSYIANGKNVGIGTKNPKATLDVAGHLKAQTLEIDGALTVGQLTVKDLPDARTAPEGADLESVVVDKATGILYMQ